MTDDDINDNDPTAARLRAALNAEAAMTNPSDDGLSTIRERTAGARPWWQHPATPALAAAAALLLILGGIVVLNGDGSSTDDDVVAGQTSSAPEPSESPETSETPPSDTPSPTPSPRDAVWVYYVMDDPASGPRLYREQHMLTPKDVPAAVVAVGEMLTAPATDPDYSSPWPSEPLVRGYRVEGDTATIELATFLSVGAQMEQVAVQQLVHTITANDERVKQVRLLVDGNAPSSGHHDWSRPVERSPRIDVQGLIWLLTPAQDDTVGSPVALSGFGTAFEGTVSWEVRREGSDEVVADGFTQGGANGEFGEFEDTAELAPGRYEVRAFESSAEDGSPVHVDTKTFTVE
jgi:hypothetical protein